MEKPLDGIPTISGGVQTEHDITVSLGEREVIARERELAAREAESKRSIWLNPAMVVLYVAVLGLAGNFGVAIYNANATRELDLHRNRAALIIEITKTGNPDAALKNLKWFSDRNLIDDPDGGLRQAIYGKTDVPLRPVGPTGPQSVPVLPATGPTGSTSSPWATGQR
jgi:hypothetical protein